MKNIKKLKLRKKDDAFVSIYNAGVDALNKSDFNTALEKFNEAKSLETEKPQVYYSIAICYENLNDLNASVEYYKLYIEKKPCSYKTLRKLFYRYYDLSDYENAIEYFNRCLEIHEEKTLCDYINSSAFNMNAQKVMDFMSRFFNLRNGDYTYIKIVKYLEKERASFDQTIPMSMVIDLYKQYIKHKPESEDTNLSISMCYARMKDWDKAIDYAQRVVVVNSDSYIANRQLGFIHYCCSQLDKAINYYKKALELSPYPDYKLYSNLAYAYEKAKKYPEAIRQFEFLMEKFPDIPAFYEIKFHTEYIRQLVID